MMKSDKKIDMKLKKTVAASYFIEISGCDYKKIDQYSFVKKVMIAFMRETGLKPVKSIHHYYKPQGLTVIWILKESHMAYHSWPEYGYVGLDLFVCGKGVKNLNSALKKVKKKFLSTTRVVVKKIDRGFF